MWSPRLQGYQRQEDIAEVKRLESEKLTAATDEDTAPLPSAYVFAKYRSIKKGPWNYKIRLSDGTVHGIRSKEGKEKYKEDIQVFNNVSSSGEAREVIILGITYD